MEETRSFAASSTVGEASAVGALVGLGISSVADGITLGGMVGSGVGSTTEVAVPAQAERRRKRIGMIFFIVTICHCEEWRQSATTKQSPLKR
jgi:hypothetical protein